MNCTLSTPSFCPCKQKVGFVTLCQDRQADVSQMLSSTAYLHNISSILADLGSGLHGFLPDLCSYFAERPQAIWCTPAQTHWWISTKGRSLDFKHTHNINNVKTEAHQRRSLSIRSFTDKEHHRRPLNVQAIEVAAVLGHITVSHKVETSVSSGLKWVLSGCVCVEAEEGRV